MRTADEDIRFLIQIVKKDLELRENRNILENHPGKIAGIDRKLRQMEERYGEASGALDKLNKEKIRLDQDVEYDNQKIAEKKNEQLSVKNNEEYRAKSLEIDFLVKKIDREESRILEILEEMEAKKKDVEEVTRQIDSEKDALQAERDRLVSAMESAEARLKQLDDEKSRILPVLSDRVRKRYERILKAKGDSGVANLIEDVCQGCYSRVPPQKAHEVRRNDSIITCEACGRILVHYPVD